MEPQRLRSKILTWHDSETHWKESLRTGGMPRNSVPVVCFLSLGKTSLLRFFLLIVVTYLSYRNGLVSFLLSDFSTAFSLPLSPTHPIFLTVSSLLQLECVHL